MSTRPFRTIWPRPEAVCCHLVIAAAAICACAASARADGPLRVSWADEILSIHGEHLPGGKVEVWYIEAFCRAGSTDRDWGETVIRHKSRLVAADKNGRRLRLRSTLDDGVTVDHTITAGDDAVDFHVTAHNPTAATSAVHWAQPCIRLDKFTGRRQDDYLDKSFILLDGALARLPVEPWASEARYTPGQVWCPRHVDPGDVNPRPLSTIVPARGLIGCYSGDDKLVLATAWEPYQELFQGVIVCLHSDFRIGGLAAGETKEIRGKIYITPADADALIERYERDFPEHEPRE